MNASIRHLALAAAAAVVLGASAAAAQQPPPPPMPPMPGMPGMGEMRHHAMEPAAHAQHLRDILQLRADQEPALKAFLAAEGPMTMDHGMMGDGDDKAPATAPDRAQRHADMAAKMAAEMQKRADATKAFYAALSPTQRKAFDAIGPRGGHPMIMRRMEMHGGMAGHDMAGKPD